MGILLFKANYRYKLRILLTLRQVKKISSTAKERMETLINLYTYLIDTAKIVQQKIKKYYNIKRSKGLDLKEGDKV